MNRDRGVAPGAGAAGLGAGAAGAAGGGPALAGLEDLANHPQMQQLRQVCRRVQSLFSEIKRGCARSFILIAD